MLRDDARTLFHHAVLIYIRSSEIEQYVEYEHRVDEHVQIKFWTANDNVDAKAGT